jgi:hypothetical protein
MCAITDEQAFVAFQFREVLTDEKSTPQIIASNGAVAAVWIGGAPHHNRSVGISDVPQPLIARPLAEKDYSIDTLRGEHVLVGNRVLTFRGAEEQILVPQSKPHCHVG